ncbi:uncharacterized protein LOC131677377 [Topomyia yanbarensis]|uniref:uncharacterized protein LOC131677377 n=1 Tax=Topomyia yanbarensis TaxID=2498891 RepID=UPI00273C0681|nr:uncharacterized protein LOC131677377 [Topomyia yanbarensis]XP_058813144.1 uncharacterized protein LOC131677377 [Topomyia yanbarensis]
MMNTKRKQPTLWQAHLLGTLALLAAGAANMPSTRCETLPQRSTALRNETITTVPPPVTDQTNELQEFENILVSYVDDALDRNYRQILTGLISSNVSSAARLASQDPTEPKNTRSLNMFGLSEFDLKIINGVAGYVDRRFFGSTSSSGSTMSRAVQNGRLFFFKGLKKIMWPLLFGLQIVKTVLLVLFLPSIIGSFGKILGKGLSSVSGLSHPATTVEDLDFKDNSYNSDQDFHMTMENNAYLPPLDSQPAAGTSYNAMIDANNANAALSRLGFGGGRVTYVNTVNDYNRQQKRNDFKIFHDIPSSSLLLTNYDPFYSPLLSRLDAVFAQMGLSNKEEACREKLVCLMYANPAKYAPYSNLISAQLSRELNELRKPTNDNPDIMRFFRYMKAAKDGQDGVDCEQTHKECITYKDLSNPAMVTTFNDINKLVLARNL